MEGYDVGIGAIMTRNIYSKRPYDTPYPFNYRKSNETPVGAQSIFVRKIGLFG